MKGAALRGVHTGLWLEQAETGEESELGDRAAFRGRAAVRDRAAVRGRAAVRSSHLLEHQHAQVVWVAANRGDHQRLRRVSSSPLGVLRGVGTHGITSRRLRSASANQRASFDGERV